MSEWINAWKNYFAALWASSDFWGWLAYIDSEYLSGRLDVELLREKGPLIGLVVLVLFVALIAIVSARRQIRAKREAGRALLSEASDAVALEHGLDKDGSGVREEGQAHAHDLVPDAVKVPVEAPQDLNIDDKASRQAAAAQLAALDRKRELAKIERERLERAARAAQESERKASAEKQKVDEKHTPFSAPNVDLKTALEKSERNENDIEDLGAHNLSSDEDEVLLLSDDERIATAPLDDEASSAKTEEKTSEVVSGQKEAIALENDTEKGVENFSNAKEQETQALKSESSDGSAKDLKVGQSQLEEPLDDALKVAREEEARLEAESKALRLALSKTRDGFVGRLSKSLSGKNIDEGIVDDLENILFTADIGVHTADRILNEVKAKIAAKGVSDDAGVIRVIRDEATKIFEGNQNKPFALNPEGLTVIMVVGVNGAGKTTTIGKLTRHFQVAGKKVVLGAGDTFRAAASEQLAVWAERNGCEIVRGKEGADPSSVLFDTLKKAKELGADVALCDTAGRLHTKSNLMDELSKVKRVLGKAYPGAPHEVVLVLDGTVGQNAIAQAKEFSQAVELDSVIMTKLDGTAKGGALLGVVDTLSLPIRYIGIGEGIEDLKPFDEKAYLEALFGSR